jgi:hypothetical protein
MLRRRSGRCDDGCAGKNENQAGPIELSPYHRQSAASNRGENRKPGDTAESDEQSR